MIVKYQTKRSDKEYIIGEVKEVSTREYATFIYKQGHVSVYKILVHDRIVNIKVLDDPKVK